MAKIQTSDDLNMFEETINATPVDYEADLPDGSHGTTYHLSFGKSFVRVLEDKRIVSELPIDKMKAGVSTSDYKAVMQMMQDIKEMKLEDWEAKYFEV